jgi:hypothetical protein
MSVLKTELVDELENEEIPIWIRAQLALRIEGGFIKNNEYPDYSKTYNELFGKRSANSRFNNLRTDRNLHQKYIESANDLLSESATNDMVNAETDILYLRKRTPELDAEAWEFGQAILSYRDSLRILGINLPIKNDNRFLLQSEMALRRSYLLKLWHNSLHAMGELGLNIPNWAKVLPYRPLVNAIEGANSDDEEIGVRLLSILEDKYPRLHSELINSNPFHSPIIGYTVGKGNTRIDSKWPTLFDIISRVESDMPIDFSWENSFLESSNLSETRSNSELELFDDSSESLIDLYKQLSTVSLRREADNREIIGAWSMKREKLISALEARIEKMDNIELQIPSISRMTDWTVLIKTNYSFVKQTFDSLDFNEEKLSLGRPEVVS